MSSFVFSEFVPLVGAVHLCKKGLIMAFLFRPSGADALIIRSVTIITVMG